MSSTVDPPPKELLTILKALPADCLRNNLVSAFGRPQSEGEPTLEPIASHQWLPGQWTPVLYGLSRDWRVFARSVLTHTLTVDLAITVSLQRPSGSFLSFLDSFLDSFPCLQNLSILAGNGGAPVDDTPRRNPTGNSSQLGLAMADVETVAIAAQHLLRLSTAEELHLSSSKEGGGSRAGPRLTALELRLHPAVWRMLRGNDGGELLDCLAVTYPALEALTLHIAGPQAAPPAGADGEPAAEGAAAAAVEVRVSPLASLSGLRRLRLAGPVAVEGLPLLTQLQSLTLEGVTRYGDVGALRLLPALTALRVADSHLRPAPAAAVAGKVAAADPAAAACVLLHLRAGPSARGLTALHLPDVTLGAKDWAMLALQCPALRVLELAAVVPYRARLPKGAVPAAAGLGVHGAVPDWFLRATVGDEAAYSTGSGGHASGGSDGRTPARQLSDGNSSDSGEEREGGGGLGGVGAVRAAVAPTGCPFPHVHLGNGHGHGGGSYTSAGGKQGTEQASGAERAPLRGLRRLVLWQYVAPWQLVQLLTLLPDLQEIQAALLLDDPPNVPAAVLRPAAVAALRPLTEVLRPLRDVRLAVSCDPAAVTGQLAGVFLMDSGLAEVPGVRGLSLHVWVAAQVQLGALAALAQLRSLELTLGKQEQESELSVLTRLHRLSYLSLRITPGIWNEIQGRTGRVSAGAALRLAMSFAAGQQLLFVADVHREICEDEAISLVKSVEMAMGQIGSAWAVSAWVEETAECIMGFGPSAGGSGTLGGNGGGDGVVLRVVWTPELVRRLLSVAAGVEGASCGGLAVSFMGAEEERLGRVLGS